MYANDFLKAEQPVWLRSGAIKAWFTADEWDGMTPSQRIERCTAKANEAMQLAQTASQQLAEAYLHLAEQWLRLGNEIGAEEKLLTKTD